LLGWLLSCGGGSPAKTNSVANVSAKNVQPISVNAGPVGNYANGVFTSVTVCVPGTSNCQTVNDVLVDTGSLGLRLLLSQVAIPLPQQNAGNGNAVSLLAG
jgi:Protein of unknown function (DUF3443)